VLSTEKTSALESQFQTLFDLNPTSDQLKFIGAFARFFVSTKPRCALILKGYAGTGKTTLIGTICKLCKTQKTRFVLLAPTGRAAKVMSHYSGEPALTIHKNIYKKSTTKDGSAKFSLAPNMRENTLFIVDEVSMIGTRDSGNGFSQRDLLDDLITYVFSRKNCRLLLVGDTAQLPPVGMDQSYALSSSYLKDEFSLTVAGIELKEVLRQESDSSILENATTLRHSIAENDESFPAFNLDRATDVERITGHDLEEMLESAYGNHGPEGTMVITRSNKRAYQFSRQIRARILWHEDRIQAGDLLMVVKNNYHWLEEEKSKSASFIANGDTLEVMKVVGYTERYGYEFADVMARFLDYPDLPPMEVKIILDSLETEGPNLGPENSKALYHYVAEDYMDLNDHRKVRAAVLADPFFNALQVKYAYAVTCHKSQGGQWPVVFIDQGYLTDEMVNVEYLRWLYTAITRAQSKLYLLNFVDQFFPEDG
jgi:exodeoxyribonuclease-5